MKFTTKELTQSAVFAAIICVLSVITIPVGTIPITLGLFGAMLVPAILGAKKGTLSVLIFMLVGLVGIPVFSGFKSGPQVFAGPTGGYLSSYILVALIIGFVSDKVKSSDLKSMAIVFASCVLGIAVCHACGTVQYMAISHVTIKEAFVTCSLFFIPFDLFKGAASAFIGIAVRKRIK